MHSEMRSRQDIAKINKLEEDLAQQKLDNDQLIFDLKVAKTKVAMLEERLASNELNTSIDDSILPQRNNSIRSKEKHTRSSFLSNQQTPKFKSEQKH
jgi:hypothetical protein